MFYLYIICLIQHLQYRLYIYYNIYIYNRYRIYMYNSIVLSIYYLSDTTLFMYNLSLSLSLSLSLNIYNIITHSTHYVRYNIHGHACYMLYIYYNIYTYNRYCIYIYNRYCFIYILYMGTYLRHELGVELAQEFKALQKHAPAALYLLHLHSSKQGNK